MQTKKLNILVVHEVSYLKKVVYEYQDFPERLAHMGHRVAVIDLDDQERCEPGVRKVSRTGLAEVSLESIPHSGLPIVKFIEARHRYKSMLEKKLKAGEVDVVFLYSVFINGTNTIRLCKKYGVPVVYRVIDVYHKVRQNHLIKWPLYFGEKFIYRRADLLSLNNDKVERYLTSMIGDRAAGRFVVNRPGVDTDHFKPRPRDKTLCERYGISDDTKVLLFLGTTYPFCGLDRILEQFGALTQRDPTLKMLIVGGGELDGRIKQIVEQNQLKDQVIMTGFKDYNELPALMSLADLGLLPFDINDITKDIVPIKIFQYLAAGIPTIATPLPDLLKFLPEEKSGVLYCDIAKVDQFVELIGKTLTNSERLKQLANDGRQYILANFSIDSQIKLIEASLYSAVSNRQ